MKRTEALTAFERQCLEGHFACDLTVGAKALHIIDEQDAALAIATALVRKWSNFDFDCPDEYNEATDEEEADGWALNQMYEETAAFFKSGAK